MTTTTATVYRHPGAPGTPDTVSTIVYRHPGTTTGGTR